jgi:hypothetical protein
LLIIFEFFSKFFYISDVMLAICIKSNDILEVIMALSNPSKSCLECCSGTSVNRMADISDIIGKCSPEQILGAIGRTIVHYQYTTIPSMKNTLDHTYDPSGFVISTDEEEDFIFFHFLEPREKALAQAWSALLAEIRLFREVRAQNKKEIRYSRKRGHLLIVLLRQYVQNDRDILGKIKIPKARSLPKEIHQSEAH